MSRVCLQLQRNTDLNSQRVHREKTSIFCVEPRIARLPWKLRSFRLNISFVKIQSAFTNLGCIKLWKIWRHYCVTHPVSRHERLELVDLEGSLLTLQRDPSRSRRYAMIGALFLRGTRCECSRALLLTVEKLGNKGFCGPRENVPNRNRSCKKTQKSNDLHLCFGS